MLLLGDKVRALRKNKNISQLDLAAIIKSKANKVVDVEAGRDEYSPKHIEAIKELFDIVGMPLDDSNRPAFVRRLYLWSAYARDERMRNEAKKIRDEAAKSINLEPCDYNLAMLYKLFDVKTLLAENNLTEAGDKFELLKNEINKLNTENLFHYHSCEGYIALRKEQYEASLDCFLKANEILANHKNFLPEGDKTIEWHYYTIAECYNFIQIPKRAKSFLLKVKEVYSENIVDDMGFHIDNMLACNHIKLNEIKEAKILLSKCLMKAQSINITYLIGIAMCSFGCLYKRTEDWKAASECFDKAIDHFIEGSDIYLANLYNKIFCIINIREFSKAQKLLERARIRYGLEGQWAVYFEALWHYMVIRRRISVRNNKSSEYIETVAIPYFEKNYEYFFIIDYCRLLEIHYDEVKSQKNSLLMSKKIKDVYERCYINN